MFVGMGINYKMNSFVSILPGLPSNYTAILALHGLVGLSFFGGKWTLNMSQVMCSLSFVIFFIDNDEVHVIYKKDVYL